MYIAGIEEAKKTHHIPYDVILDYLNNFRESGYKNEWEFKSKTFRKLGIKASLYCKMTMDHFSLSFEIAHKAEILFQQEILNTLPDEIMFSHQFKDIVYENGAIKVINFAKGTIYSLDWY